MSTELKEAYWTVAKLTRATGGVLLQGDPNQSIANISTDTRRLQPTDCFVALPGEHSDGHAFIADALAKGTRALVVSAKRGDHPVAAPADVAIIEVRDQCVVCREVIDAGARLVDEHGRPGAHGSTVAFLHPKSFGGVLVELCQGAAKGQHPDASTR